jgi:tetratricopeptide (TPR) repeat protein
VAHRPLERLHDAVAAADRYRAVLPALDDPRHVRLLYEHVVTGGDPAELVVSSDLLDGLRAEFPRRTAAMAESGEFDVLVGDVPPYALVVLETERRDDTDVTLYLVVFADLGSGVHGVLVNDTHSAVRWAEDRFETYRADAALATGSLLADPDGGTRPADVDDGLADPVVGRSLPVALEREGFVCLDVEYFREEPVADPTTAWRAGLSLPEVHTGYAAARTLSDGDGDVGEGPTTLTAALLDRLAGGEDCVLMGPPGAGKSVACKRVACEWYDEERGRVLYREGGRGRPFRSVEDLLLAVEAADGHALVVVEDAVRTDADAVFDALDRLGGREDVSVLLDAREHEWRDPPGEPGDVSGLEVLHVPPLDDGGARRLVERFERTTGESVDVPLDRLREAVRTAATGDDEAAPDEVLLLLHRLATYADPLAEERSSLEAAVAGVYDDLAGDDIGLAVCTLANALNAAGLEVARPFLYVVADSGEFGAVEAAVERLEGRVLFPRATGLYRTVHEAWSVAFLEHLLEAEGEDAACQWFGDAVSALLALADDPDHRDAVAAHCGERGPLADVADDPGRWADGTAEAVAALGREHPKLAPLYGDGERGVIDLPAACSEAVVEEWPARLGRLFVSAGHYDRAERSFERVPDDGALAVERLLGLARVASHRGKYEDAVAFAEKCLSLVEGANRPVTRARIRRELGYARSYLGEFEAAEDALRAALDAFEAAEDRRRTARVLHDLGITNVKRGVFDRSRECFERSLELRRDLGDRRGEADCLYGLGDVARKQGEYERAHEFHRRALDVERVLGDRQGEANALNNLAIVAAMQGEFGRAEDYFERSLEIKRGLDDRQGEAHTRNNLGNLARRLGEYDQAREHFRRSFEIKRDLGDRHGEATTLVNLGELARRRGEYDHAARYHEQGLELSRDLDIRPVEADNLGNLGELDRLMGAHDRARERLERAVDIADDVGRPVEVVRNRRRLGELARIRGEYDRAREQFEAALAAFDADEDPFETTQVTLARGRLALAHGDVDLARERGETAREAFATLDAVVWVAMSRRLLGEVAAATGDLAAARDHLASALETFEDVGAPQDALATIEHLVETCREVGDDEAAREHCRRADELLADAPEPVVEQHRGWVDDRLAELDAD